MNARVVLLALVPLAACASENEKRSDPAGDARVVPLAELPESYRSAWAAWRQGSAAFELERARVERDPALAAFLVDNLVREMVRTYDRSGFARPGGEPGPFERAQSDLVAFAEVSTPVLAELLRVPDGIVAFLAADRLVVIGAPAVTRVVPLLADPRAETRRRAAELLGKLPHAGAGEVDVLRALAARVESDEEWPVRAEAARALGARGRNHEPKGYALGVLLRAAGEADHTVAASAADAIGVLGERRAIPRLADVLEAAVRAGEPAVVAAAQRALALLAGDDVKRTPAQWRAYAER